MHNKAKFGEIAKNIILVGDPNRATQIANEYLEDVKLVNDVRCAYCYTGKFEGKEVSVMAVGMGGPSMMIYATELCRDYGCEKLLRLGTSGGYREDMRNYDAVLSMTVSSTGGINNGLFNGHYSPCADFSMLKDAYEVAEELGVTCFVGPTIANDRLYRGNWYESAKWKKYGILASEQEGEAFYTACAEYGKKALMIVGLVCGIKVEEDGSETFFDLEDRNPAKTMKDLELLALKTITK